jgi:HNH endonuclease
MPKTSLARTYPDGTIEHRLAAQTEIDPLSGCHIWQGRRDRNGYPLVRLNGREHRVHRLAWTLRYGRIRDGLELCHRCDEPRCINPDHHFVGTHQANMADRRLKNRARRERVLADFRGAGWPGDEFPPGELSRMRMYVRGMEITGKVRIRPFRPDERPPRRTARRP